MKQTQQQFCQRILPIVTAGANGETIEYKSGQTWVEKDGSGFHFDAEYRIKPTPAVTAENQHTPEPWATDYRQFTGIDGIDAYAQEIFDSSGNPIAQLEWYPVYLGNGVTGTNRKANAKRIVLCVNALEGVPTEALEGGWTAQGISAYAKSLERNQNDMVECLLRILVMAQAAGDESEKDSNNPYKAFLYEAGQLVRRCGTEDQVRSLSNNQ